MSKTTNMDFCKSNKMSIYEMEDYKKSLGFKSFDEFANSKCNFKPKFAKGDVIFSKESTRDKVYIVADYKSWAFEYALIPIEDVRTLRVASSYGCEDTRELAYHLERKYTIGGHLDEMMKMIRLRRNTL